MTRRVTSREYCHERLGDAFGTALSDYDTRRRVDVLVDEFLGDRVRGKTVLDVGCGLGFFSKRLADLGAHVTATDIGPGLVEKTKALAGCEGRVADAMELESAFGADRYDVVVSSECIEHVPDPSRCLRQMIEVLRPGGLISVSTPNLVWYPVVRAATVLKLRPFDGHENFSTWGSLSRTMRQAGVEIVRAKGLHLFPFQLGMHGLSTWLDERAQFARGVMINICLLGRKKSPADSRQTTTP